MARISILGCLAWFVSGCMPAAIHNEMVTNPAVDNFSYVYYAMKPKIPEWVPTPNGVVLAGTTPGAYRRDIEGDTFENIDTLDPRNAMVFIYRPQSEWGDLELQSPSVFVNDERLFGLASNSYRWLELHGGEYKFYARRPFWFVHVKEIFGFPLNVDGGDVIYMRYSETEPVDLKELVSDPENYIVDGPLQQVPESFALQEIPQTVLDEAGVYFSGGKFSQDNWKPFDAFEGAGGDEDSYSVTQRRLSQLQ